MAKTLQVVREAGEPPTLIALAFLDEGESFATEAEMPFWENENLQSLVEKVKVRVNARCTDLLEVFRDPLARFPPLTYRVNFLHRTVKDFIGTPEMKNRLASWISGPFDANVYLCKAFLVLTKIFLAGSRPQVPDMLRDTPRVTLLIDKFFHYGG